MPSTMVHFADHPVSPGIPSSSGAAFGGYGLSKRENGIVEISSISVLLVEAFARSKSLHARSTT